MLIHFFLQQVRKLIHEDRGILRGQDIKPVEKLPAIGEIADYASAGVAALPRAVVIKLNGGLGTSMGLETTKSLLKAKNGCSFLDLAFRQVEYLRRRYRCRIPLILMNSFYTQAETAAALEQKRPFIAEQAPIPISFSQHRVPKLRAEDYLPVQYPQAPDCEWCPPGHGDLYLALRTSGLLDLLLDSDIEYAFVSNSDNLGAVLDVSLLGYMATQHIPFILEVTQRTEADRKGGHLAVLRDGRLALREIAQCPPDEIDDFMDTQRYRFFNTNNLWVNLRILSEHLDRAGGFFDLPLIVNRKLVNPGDSASPSILQLECAMGAAIQVFPGARAVLVPRERFSPVKTTDDLLALWSDAYVVQPNGQVVLHPERHGRPVLVQLDKSFYGAYGDFSARFSKGAPALLECTRLTVEGDLRFGANVKCRGEVYCKNIRGQQADVPDGICLEGRITF